MRGLPILLLAAALGGCAAVQSMVQKTKAQMTLVEGLRQYDAGDHATSAKTLASALELGLGEKDQGLAHKHLAFIHCSANRDRQCREEFRLALAADPGLQLEPAEAGHPVWGPIFLSMSPGFAFATGIQQYEDGQYDESAKNLQTALDRGLIDKQRARAHKYLAFMHCASSRERQCREEFRKALADDPGLELNPAEASHPVWGPIFKSLKAGQ